MEDVAKNWAVEAKIDPSEGFGLEDATVAVTAVVTFAVVVASGFVDGVEHPDRNCGEGPNYPGIPGKLACSAGCQTMKVVVVVVVAAAAAESAVADFVG